MRSVQIGALTAAQVDALSTAQVAAMGDTQFLPDYNFLRRRTYWLRY
jgi:hypothetical protein